MDMGWPFAIFLIAVAGMGIFWLPIARLIDRVKSVKMPGAHLDASGEQAKAVAEVGPTLSAAPDVPGPLAPPKAGQVLTEEDASRILAAISSLQRASDTWHFGFLNYYLVSGSQLVLEWIDEQGARTHSEFDAHFFGVAMPDRRSMVAALRDHGLIHIHPLTFEITAAGKNYLAWHDRNILFSQNTPKDREVFESRIHAKTLSAATTLGASVETKVFRAPVGPPSLATPADAGPSAPSDLTKT
jgi:hypothetical protein